MILDIKNLSVNVGDVTILTGLNLQIPTGEVHAIMGPNGAGKSTLANVVAGKDGYDIEVDNLLFNGTDIAEMEPEERALAGLFLAFQYPVEVPGVTNRDFMRMALNEARKHRGEPELDLFDFTELALSLVDKLDMKRDMLERSVNVGFSGGEKKKNDIFQMAMLDPKLALMDETDSGLDIDALKIVANGVNELRDSTKSFLIVTHYQRLLNYIQPDCVHIMVKGTIVESGSYELVKELEKNGYAQWL